MRLGHADRSDAVNLTGAFVIELVQELGAEATVVSDNTRLFLTTGIMGGLTTYSAFCYEAVRLMEANAWAQAWLNVVLTTRSAWVSAFWVSWSQLVLSIRG